MNNNRIAALGDSVTKGFDGFENLQENYPNYLSQIINLSVDNFGVNGATIVNDLTNEINDVNWKQYNQCILFIGTNDYGHNPNNLNEVTSKLKQDLNLIYQFNSQIIISAILPLNRYDQKQNAANKRRFANYTFNELLDALAQTYRTYTIPVLDWRKLYPNFINDNNYQSKYNDKHVHPTAQTYYQIANKIADFIKK
ncbi:SGNH/GDSL hydrolase family protein [Apilactobacillus quenuiae]|uniref:SGNH/GDSL hydrolase family protein n=1 Tax=Apilactobacillus quenuiae TaxID=2008377 RepID=UPI000D012AE2|nr:SGNH/GDSL hydrolase family protein [Apilactobacillus quenuiae]